MLTSHTACADLEGVGWGLGPDPLDISNLINSHGKITEPLSDLPGKDNRSLDPSFSSEKCSGSAHAQNTII